LCPTSAIKDYDIEFVAFKLANYETKKKIFGVNPEIDFVTNGDHVYESVTEYDGDLRNIKYTFQADDILKTSISSS